MSRAVVPTRGWHNARCRCLFAAAHEHQAIVPNMGRLCGYTQAPYMYQNRSLAGLQHTYGGCVCGQPKCRGAWMGAYESNENLAKWGMVHTCQWHHEDKYTNSKCSSAQT